MKKNKLFVILSIITLILVFGVAATCNLCGAPIQIGETDESDVAADKVTKKEEKSGQEQSSQAGQAQQESSQQTQQAEEAEEPGDESGGELIDEPDPESGEGPIDDPADEEPTDEEDTDLSIVEMEEVMIEDAINIRADYDNSGFVREDEDWEAGIFFIGDDINNLNYKSFISFNIRFFGDYSEVIVNQAELMLGIGGTHGIIGSLPFGYANNLIIKYYEYDDLDPGDYAGGGTHLRTFPISEVAESNILSFSSSAPLLVSTIQQAIDTEKPWYQLKLEVDGMSDDDDEMDYIHFYPGSAYLSIYYEYSS
jgi:hypothetical protein